MKNKNEPTSDSRRSIQIQTKDPRRKEPTKKKKKERIMKNKNEPTSDSRRMIQGGKNLQISVLKNSV